MPSSGKFETFFIELPTEGTPDSASDYLMIHDASTNSVKKVLVDDISAAAGGIPVTGWVAAGETWTYASADDPTFTFTIAGVDLTTKYQAGMKIKLTQTTPKYFIITKVAFSTNTTITIYGGTDYDLADAEITSPLYSPVKVPFGFPIDPAKWTVITTDTSLQTQGTPTANTWYNTGTQSITIPIGIWRVSYQVGLEGIDSSAAVWSLYSTLSTANNTESDADFTAFFESGSDVNVGGWVYKEKVLGLASKTTYYLNQKTSSTGLDNMYLRNDQAKMVIRAESVYL